MKFHLVVLTPGKWMGKCFRIREFPFLIGRDSQCQLRPRSARILPHHCALEFRDHEVWLYPFKGASNISLNDRPLSAARRVGNGDHLQVGALHFEMRITVEAPKQVPVLAQSMSAAIAVDDSAAALLLELDLEDGPQPSAGSSMDTIVEASHSMADTVERAAIPASSGSQRPQQAPIHDSSSVADMLLRKGLRRFSS